MKFTIFKMKNVPGDIKVDTPWVIACPDGMIYFEAKFEHCIWRMNLVAGAIGWKAAA